MTLVENAGIFMGEDKENIEQKKINMIKVICNIFILISILFHFNFCLNTNKSYADLYVQEKNFNKQNVSSGYFKKLNSDNKNIKINGHGIKLKEL